MFNSSLEVDLVLDSLLDQLDRPRDLFARGLVEVNLRDHRARPPLAQHLLPHRHVAAGLALAKEQARKVRGLAAKLDAGIRN